LSVSGLALTGLGAAFGLVGAVAASRALITLLFGISQLDPATYVGGIVLLAAVAAIACGRHPSSGVAFQFEYLVGIIYHDRAFDPPGGSRDDMPCGHV